MTALAAAERLDLDFGAAVIEASPAVFAVLAARTAMWPVDTRHLAAMVWPASPDRLPVIVVKASRRHAAGALHTAWELLDRHTGGEPGLFCHWSRRYWRFVEYVTAAASTNPKGNT